MKGRGASFINSRLPSGDAPGVAHSYLDAALIEALGVAVYTTDPAGRITLFNDAAVKLWGRRPTVGKDLWCGSWRIYWPDGQPMALDECPMAIALKEDRTVRDIEIVVERPDGSRAFVLPHPTPLHDGSGTLIGAVNVMVDITDRKRAELALLDSQEQLTAELAATQILQETSSRLIQEDDVEALYEQILDAAKSIMRSDMASMQILDETRDALRLKAWRGFDPEFGKIFEFVGPDTKTSCSVARRVGHRVVVPDVDTWDYLAGTPALEDHHRTGIRAVQSTPLVSRSGKLLGMISTHWRQPHEPQEQHLRLLDVLARQAADLIERSQAEADRRQGHEAALRLAAIVQSSDDAIVSKDLNGIVTSWNKGAERMFGYTAEETIGQSIRLIIPAERQEEEDYVLARVRGGEPVEHFETIRRRKDGTMLPISLTVSPVKDPSGKVIGASKIARDISERKEAEEAIARSMAVKDQFLSLVSHELRTPITTVLGNGQLLQRHRQTMSEEDINQGLTDIVTGSQRLQRVIENLLLLTKMDAGVGIEVEPLLVRRLLADAAESYGRRNSARTILLTLDDPLAVAIGHESSLTQVLENLISNADKYSPPEEPIEIMTGLNDSGEVEVRVRDHGIGLDAAELESIFTPFYRSLSAKAKASGLGLGLAVSKRLIEAQNGRIWAETRPGGGCDFVFTVEALGVDSSRLGDELTEEQLSRI